MGSSPTNILLGKYFKKIMVNVPRGIKIYNTALFTVKEKERLKNLKSPKRKKINIGDS